MNIVYFGDVSPTGGTGTFYLRLYDLISKGHNVFPVISTKYAFDERLKKKLSAHNISNVEIYLGNKVTQKIEFYLHLISIKLKFEGFYMYLRDSLIMRWFCLKHKADFVITSSGGFINYFPMFRFKIPAIYIMHSLLEEVDGYISKKLSSGKNIQNKALVFVSNSQKNTFMSLVKSEEIKKRCITIPNYALPPQKIKRETAEGKITVLTFGVLEHYKNPDVWLEVARRVTKENPEIEFIWAGTSGKLEMYRQKVKDNPRIKYVGYFDHPIDLYKIADIYFQPTIYETQGIAAIEAMSYKIPCVVSDSIGLPESVADGISGFVSPIFEVEPYVKNIKKLAADKALRDKMGEEGFKIYKEKFIEELWAKRFTDLINSLSE